MNESSARSDLGFRTDNSLTDSGQPINTFGGGTEMFKRYSIRKLDEEAIAMLAEIRTMERREIGAIVEDCIVNYWHDITEAEDEDDT